VLTVEKLLEAMKVAASASFAVIAQLQQQEHGGDRGFGGSGQDEEAPVAGGVVRGGNGLRG
jgi:hypothetical protein